MFVYHLSCLNRRGLETPANKTGIRQHNAVSMLFSDTVTHSGPALTQRFCHNLFVWTKSSGDKWYVMNTHMSVDIVMLWPLLHPLTTRYPLEWPSIHTYHSLWFDTSSDPLGTRIQRDDPALFQMWPFPFYSATLCVSVSLQQTDWTLKSGADMLCLSRDVKQ